MLSNYKVTGKCMNWAPLDLPTLAVVVSPVSDRASVTIPTWKGNVQSGNDKEYIVELEISQAKI